MHSIRTAVYQAAPTFDPSKSVANIRILLVAVLGLCLIMVTISAVFSHGRRGDNHRAIGVASASLLSLIPGAIGAAGLALAVGGAFLNWSIPGLTN